jgi:hypothetical protein
MAKETAEQKLLKILEASGQSLPKAGGGFPTGKKPPFKLQFSIQMLNVLLILGIVVCLVVLGLEFQSGSALLQGQVDLTLDDQVPHRSTEVAFPKAKDISYYAQKISSRNIFKPYEKEQLAKATGPVKSSLANKLSKYKVVGIAWLDLPESISVMIEDTKTNMTYFLREGEKLDDVTVKTIYTDRVVLSCENEEITIKL